MGAQRHAGLLWGIYMLAGVVDLGSEYIQNLNGIIFSKPLLMAILILIVLFTPVNEVTKPPRKYLILALAFSWLGDMLLLLSNVLNHAWLFLAGIGGFLIAHLFYITIFTRYKRNHHIHLIKAGSLAIFYLGLNYYFLPHLDLPLKIAVPLYSLVISLMVYQAWTTAGHIAPRRFYWIAVGAFLFFFSDLMIAFHRFLDWEFSFLPIRFWIMLTYILAQGFICRGILMKIPAFIQR